MQNNRKNRNTEQKDGKIVCDEFLLITRKTSGVDDSFDVVSSILFTRDNSKYLMCLDSETWIHHCIEVRFKIRLVSDCYHISANIFGECINEFHIPHHIFDTASHLRKLRFNQNNPNRLKAESLELKE